MYKVYSKINQPEAGSESSFGTIDPRKGIGYEIYMAKFHNTMPLRLKSATSSGCRPANPMKNTRSIFPRQQAIPRYTQGVVSFSRMASIFHPS